MPFGENIEGYQIRVFNEREIRAGAGILFFALMIGWMNAALLGDLTIIKHFLGIFMLDLIIRIFINPRYAPFLILGRWIVRKQVPLYVGAPQKRFAWILGLLLSGTMFIYLILFNRYHEIVSLVCLTCLLFLWFETSFGICLGCKIYGLFHKDKAQYCPGEVCERKDRHVSQKISTNEIIFFFVFALLATFLSVYFHDFLSRSPF
jgi:hypothetical protein